MNTYFIPTQKDNIIIQKLQKENEDYKKLYESMRDYANLWEKRYFAILDDKCENGETHHRAKINSLCNKLVESQLDKVIEYIQTLQSNKTL